MTAEVAAPLAAEATAPDPPAERPVDLGPGTAAWCSASCAGW